MAEDLQSVLLVDDDPDTVEFVKAIISDVTDFNIFTAHDGEAGLQKAKEELPDLIILDVMMPKKTGFEMFYDLRSETSTRDIPVIMLTGVSEQTGIPFSARDMQQYIGKAPEDFIEKPVDPSRLQVSVKKALNL